MRYRMLGKSELRVSTVAMGCWAIVGDATWGKQDEGEALRTIHKALDLGINFFDTAEGYGGGYSEELLAKALPKRRDELVIATKVSPAHLQPAELRASCEASLRRLKTERLDLYQLHWPDHKADYRAVARTLGELVREGKVRAIGVSNFGPEDMAQYAEDGQFVANQLAYNLLFRAIEAEIQAECVKRGVGILCYSPLCQGLLTGKFRRAEEVPEGRARTRHFAPIRPQVRHKEPGLETETFAAIDALSDWCARKREPLGRVALAWLLHQPAVAAVLAGARNPLQVAENAAAAELDLDATDLTTLAECTETLTRKLGTNADMWQSQSRLH